MEYVHIPVMASEVMMALALEPGDRVIDATLGLGGHARLMLDAIGPSGRLLGIERTAEGLQEARRRIIGRTLRPGSGPAAPQGNLTRLRSQATAGQATPRGSAVPPATLVHGDFRNLGTIAREADFPLVAAILFDLGLASWQIDTGHRGLSFQVDRLLDMRLSPQQPSDFTRKEDDPSQWIRLGSAGSRRAANAALAQVVRTWRFRSAAELLFGATEEEITLILKGLGDVKGARTIARKLVDRRTLGPIESTSDLISVLGTSRPEHLAPIFQALRIVVNDEYGALVAGLHDAWELLQPSGRLAVISFHSGEDRIVKRFLKGRTDAELGRPIRPSDKEVKENPRSRSAILRTAKK